jgi:hypothetical protein
MNVLSERISNEQLCESTNCPFDCSNKFNVSEIKEFYLKLNPEGRKKSRNGWTVAYKYEFVSLQNLTKVKAIHSFYQLL